MSYARSLLLALTISAVPIFAVGQEVEEASEQPTAPLQKTEAKTEVSNVDRAFGAFQRGMYLTAFYLALPEAQAGNAAAQTLIAELYDSGLGIAQDPEEAFSWYKIAANSGNREAQFAYAVKLLEGKVTDKNVELGMDIMKSAADAGHPTAMFNYATYRINQRPTGATYRKVLPMLEKAAEYRLADAYYALAKIYEEGLATGVSDPERGLVWLERAAMAGIDTAQVELALKFISGSAGVKDEARAFSLLKIAANRGNVIAQNRIAHLLFLGLGTERSEVEAAKWHILASRAGRSDFDLDRQMETLSADVKQQALQQANRWPSVN
ncbi:MAG: tetratricopeptide repeat protein [Pseudomonadota bacterium]